MVYRNRNGMADHNVYAQYIYQYGNKLERCDAIHKYQNNLNKTRLNN